MRTVLADDAEPAVRVAEHDQIFTEQTSTYRRAVRLAHLLGHADRQPVRAHQVPHRSVAFDAAQQVVFFGGQHGDLRDGAVRLGCRPVLSSHNVRRLSNDTAGRAGLSSDEPPGAAWDQPDAKGRSPESGRRAMTERFPLPIADP